MVEALSALLEAEPSITIVGTAGRADQAADMYDQLRPDVLVADKSMPGGGGIEALRRILAVDVGARVLFLSADDDPAVIREAVELGAAGYVHKSAPTKELIAAVLAVSRGDFFFDAVGAAGIAAAMRAGGTLRPRLSDQETAVLALVADGQSNPSIGAALNLAPSTVKTYLDRVFTKLGVRDRSAAVARAKDLKLL
jgi:DNA-binding NarL/FixJ family response regulator